MIVDITAALDYQIEDHATVLLQIEAAAMLDQRILSGATQFEAHDHFARVPAEDGVGERTWIRVAHRLACTYTARVEVDRPVLDLTQLTATPLELLTGDLVKYLMDSRFVPAEKFKPFVESEFAGLAGGARIATIRDWIEAHLEYVPGTSDAETTAVDTLVARQGVCRDYAHLMVALARASHIPARMVSVYAPGVAPPDFHAVAEIYLDGSWHLVDATGMATPDEMVRIGVGRDAADIAFMMVFGKTTLNAQSVSVTRA